MTVTTSTPSAQEQAESLAEDVHPFQGLLEGWVPVDRNQRGSRPSGRQVESVLEIVLDPDRSAWLWREAERLNTDTQTLVESLIDTARTAGR